MTLGQDIGYAWRSLRRAPGFTALVIFTLGLGLAVNSTFFSLTYGAALRGLPLREPARMISVTSRDARSQKGVSYLDFRDLRTAATTVDLAASSQAPAALADDDRPAERVMAAYVSGGTMSLLGNTPTLGRDLTDADDRPGAEPVAALSHTVWTVRYGSDPGIVGRRVRLNGATTTIVGVMPKDFAFTGDAGVWLPLASLPGLTAQPRDARGLTVIGRLRPRVTLEQARGEIETLTNQLRAEHQDTNRDIAAVVVPLNDRYTQRIIGTVWVTFLAAGIVVLLVACANVANLLLARGAVRTAEIAIRTSLGASRRRIVRQLLIEAAALAIPGCLLGIVLSYGALQALSTMVPAGSVPYWFRFDLNLRILAALILVCAGSVPIFAMVPAIYTSRGDLETLLRHGGRLGHDDLRARRWTSGFLAVQVGLAFVLLSTIATEVRTNWAIERLDTPITATAIMTASLTLPAASYPEASQRASVYDRLVTTLEDRADVSGTALATGLPYAGGPARPLRIEGRDRGNGGPATVAAVGVTPGYFTVMGAAVMRGRVFRADEDAVVVNQRFAEMYFAGQDAVGHRIRLGDGVAAPWRVIVGVAPVILRQHAQVEPDPVVYEPFSKHAATAVLLVRGRQDVPPSAASLRDVLRGIDGDLPLYRTATLDRAMRDANWNGRASRVILRTISMIASLLALVGFYAVTARAVASQGRELGLRVAFGARRLDVSRLVLRRAFGRLAIGLGVGVALTVLWERQFQPEGVAGIHLVDPLTLAITGSVVVAAAALACLAPVRRALRFDPAQILRES